MGRFRRDIDYADRRTDPYIKTIEEYNRLARAIRDDKDWFVPFMELVEHYCDADPTAGCLHIVLDDGNLGNSSIAWCAGLAHGVNDHEGNDLANLMRIMTMDQREKVYASLF